MQIADHARPDELKVELGSRRTRISRIALALLSSPVIAASSVFVILVVILAAFAPAIAPYDPLADNVAIKLEGPSWYHPFGTDALGRDILSRMIFGTRPSLAAAIASVALSVSIGVPVGLISGYVSGIADEIAMRFIDAIVAFPSIILALAFVAAFGASLRSVIIAIAIVSIPMYARLMRAQVLSVKESEYTVAAAAIGASPSRIMLRHILPNCLAPIIVAATLGMSFAVLAEASLSFLGAGVQPPTPTWGGMLSEASRYIYTSAYMSVFPGLSILLLVLSLNLLGDALQDALDPRAR